MSDTMQTIAAAAKVVVPVALILIGVAAFHKQTTKNTSRRRGSRPSPAPSPRPAPAPRPAQAQEEVRRLAQELAALERELEWLESLQDYSSMLHSVLGPVQVLIGCGDAPELTENQRQYFLQPRALQPLSAAAERFRRLPQRAPAPGAVTKVDVEARLGMPVEELRDQVWEFRRRAKVDDHLRRDYELLTELEKAGIFRLTEADAASAGKMAAAALRRHGIFPLYRDEVKDQPELWDSFNEGNSLMTAYPGLFLSQDGKYELFAAYNGIWV